MIVLLISIAILSMYYKFGHCDKCSFKIENKSNSAAEFMSLYSNKCLTKEKINQPLNYSLIVIPSPSLSQEP
jgi:hypothetical protein